MTTPTITRTVDARGSYCPGPLMELIRAIREGAVGDTIAVLSSDKGSKVDIPKWIEKECGPRQDDDAQPKEIG